MLQGKTQAASSVMACPISFLIATLKVDHSKWEGTTSDTAASQWLVPSTVLVSVAEIPFP